MAMKTSTAKLMQRTLLKKRKSQQSEIIETGSVTAQGRHLIHCLTIIGQVEGHYILPPQNKTTKYEHVIPQLVAIEEDEKIKGLVIILNTVGGDVEAGLAIAELIAGRKSRPCLWCWAAVIRSAYRLRSAQNVPLSCRPRR